MARWIHISLTSRGSNGLRGRPTQGRRGRACAGHWLRPSSPRRAGKPRSGSGGAHYLLQNCGVNSTITDSNSSRPSIMARLHSQIWKSVSTA